MSKLCKLLAAGFTEDQARRITNPRFAKGYDIKQRFENWGTITIFMWCLNKDARLSSWVFWLSDSLKWTCKFSPAALKAATIVTHDRYLVWSEKK